MFRGMGGLASLLMNPKALEDKLKDVAVKLKTLRVVGSGGGGLVTLEMNGLMEVLECRIDPRVFEVSERRGLETMTAQAVSDAVAQARAAHAELMKSVFGDMPGMEQAMGLLGGPR